MTRSLTAWSLALFVPPKTGRQSQKTTCVCSPWLAPVPRLPILSDHSINPRSCACHFATHSFGHVTGPSTGLFHSFLDVTCLGGLSNSFSNFLKENIDVTRHTFVRNSHASNSLLKPNSIFKMIPRSPRVGTPLRHPLRTHHGLARALHHIDDPSPTE